MKVKVEIYKLVCDSCGETFENGNGFTCYTDDPDGSLIWEDASASNWLKVGDKHYCPDCEHCGAWEKIPKEEFIRNCDKDCNPNEL